MMTTPALVATPGQDLMLRIVEEAFRRQTWSGTNLWKSLRDVTPEEAAWVPPHTKHSIAAIVLHCAYWKHAVSRRLRRERKRSFPLRGSDWFDVPAPLTQVAWVDCTNLLKAEHERLRAAVQEDPEGCSWDSEDGRKLARQAFGIAMHDMYHAGQIALIRAQYRRRHAP